VESNPSQVQPPNTRRPAFIVAHGPLTAPNFPPHALIPQELQATFQWAIGDAGRQNRQGGTTEYVLVRRPFQGGGTETRVKAREIEPTLANLVYYLNNINKLWYHDGIDDTNDECTLENEKTVNELSNRNKNKNRYNKKTQKNKAHKLNKLKSRKNSKYVIKV
jgi:hypothetical protein